MRKSVMFAFVLFLVSGVSAVDYYVDYENGVDSNPGTQTQPWKHCPGDSNFVGSYTPDLINGDTFIFRGRVSYIGEIDVISGVDSSNRIIYDGNTAGTFGTGRAVIDLNHEYYHAFNANSDSYFTIQGFEIKRTKNTKSSQGVTGSCPDDYAKVYREGICQCAQFNGENLVDNLGTIKIRRSNNVVIDNLIIHETENWEDGCCLGSETDGDDSTLSPNSFSDQIGIDIYDNNFNVTVKNSELYAAGKYPIRLQSSSHVYLLNNNIGGSNAGAQEGYFSVAFSVTMNSSNVVIKNNEVHDGWQYQGDDNQSYHRCHSGNWFHFYGNNNHLLDADPHDILIEGNFVYSDHVYQCPFGSGLGQFESDVFNLTIKNNVVVNPGFRGFSISDASNVKLLGNLFVHYNPTGADCYSKNTQSINFGRNDITDDWIRHTVKNNIIIQQNLLSHQACMNIDGSIPINKMPDSDYNLCYRINGDTAVRYNSVSYTLSEWQAYAAANLQGQDANSVSGNPNLVDLPLTGAAVSSGDYHLSDLSTLAINNGISLSDLIYDKDGNIRGSPPDIGAYEYAGPTCEATSGNCYYVDNAAGGNNDGSSWSDAWTSFNNINWGLINPGDYIYISGGTTSKTYYEGLDIQSSGTSGNPITIKVGQDVGHDGMVIFGIGATYGIGFNGNSFVTVNGKGNIAGTPSSPYENINYIKMRVTGTTNRGAYSLTSNNLKLLYVHIYRVGDSDNDHGIDLRNPTNTEIAYCDIEDPYHDGIRITGSSEFSQMIVHHNWIHGMTDDGMAGNGGADIYNNIVGPWGSWSSATGHPDGMQLYQGYLRIYNNLFYSDYWPDGSNALLFLNYAFGDSGQEQNYVYVYNNVFMTAGESYTGAHFYGVSVQAQGGAGFENMEDLKIFHNTFVDVGYSPISIGSEANGIFSNFSIKNNLIYNSRHTGGSNGVGFNGFDFVNSDVDFDNNLLHAGVGGRDGISWDGFSYSVPEFNSAFGKSNINQEPTFIQYTAGGGLNNDLHLHFTDAAVLNAGADLSAFSYLTLDKDGNLRPQGAGWDIGAYEYLQTAVYHEADTTAPFGVIDITELMIYITDWKYGDGSILMGSVIEAIGHWKAGSYS